MKSHYVLYFLSRRCGTLWTTSLGLFSFRIGPSPSFIYSWSISNILLNGLFGQYLWKKSIWVFLPKILLTVLLFDFSCPPPQFVAFAHKSEKNIKFWSKTWIQIWNMLSHMILVRSHYVLSVLKTCLLDPRCQPYVFITQIT